ncbi:MAG: T9SS type A sorting domain-containing protein [Candidatus Neomarinimicrobiota bacterium]
MVVGNMADRCCRKILKLFINVLVLIIWTLHCAPSQVLPEYHNISKDFTKTVSLNYLIYTPPNYRPNESWPVLFYLTGLEGTEDINAIRNYGPPKMVESGLVYDYFIIAPQLPGDVHWDPDALNALLSKLRSTYNLDDSRFYITGIGDRGGWGVYEFCVSYPGTFHRLAPVSATACTEICRIGNASTWIFQGALDDIVPVADAENMAYELDYYCETENQLTLFDSLGHEIWDQAYSEEGFWEWLVGSPPSFGAGSAQASITEFSTEITKEIDDNYLLYLPASYDSTAEDWPLVVFLHGAGSAIYNIDNIRQAGPPMLYEQGMDSDFVLVCPQLYDDVHWDVDRLYVLTKHILDTYRIDESRIYLTGLSRGGFGTWEFAVSYPELFAAVVPISARDVPGVERLKDSNVWVFHGALDDGVPWQGAQFMYNRLLNVDANVKLTMYANVGHWAWIPAYETDSLWTWILAQQSDYVVVIDEPIYSHVFSLDVNYPNPFNPTTTIGYNLQSESSINLSVYDVAGRLITTLINDHQSAGRYEILWNGRDISGNPVSSGVYFYQLSTGDYVQTRKMLLLK